MKNAEIWWENQCFYHVDKLVIHVKKIHTADGRYPVCCVDKVEKLFSEQVFADFYYVSSTHSYQQISVDTIFQ